MKRSLLVTGGAGFIGSHLSEYLLQKYPDFCCVVYDSLSYAGRLSHLENIMDHPNFIFIQGDIRDQKTLKDVFQRYHICGVFHLAAHTHVDRSIIDPLSFVENNVLGCAALLEICRQYVLTHQRPFRLLHVSSDEVFGSIPAPHQVNEEAAYHPRSPYSACKAAADHLVRAYYHSYHLPILISYCSNNFGPRQHPEKLIPHTILKALRKEMIPIYGDGLQVRDWLAVADHVKALELIFRCGEIGRSYCVSAHCERTNLSVVRDICTEIAKILGTSLTQLESLMTHVTDRPGHDRRYALKAKRINQELHWQPQEEFNHALAATVRWYVERPNYFNHANIH
ncbi:MAG: dTDP-glucose 4,6-dehydratase [Francisella sp.]|jgi:dTDP-glucose 4,6-dehydratase|nr:MAG: dTDP-glucose 4,6-dehydratase [Francisella sp.]